MQRFFFSPSWGDALACGQSTRRPKSLPQRICTRRRKTVFATVSTLRLVEAYQKLKSAYPDFEKMAAVYVKIGDALYAKGDYEKAISRYLQFLELYPAHPFAPRVKYFIAMSYFRQIKKLESG